MKKYDIAWTNNTISEECILGCPDKDVQYFLRWWTEQDYDYPLCFSLCFDLNFIADTYDKKGWMDIDFIYDSKLDIAFLWCPYHDGLLYALYCYHNKLDVDSNWSYHPEIIEKYLDKYGMLKSSVSSSIFCGESVVFPAKLLHLNYLADDIKEYLYVRD